MAGWVYALTNRSLPGLVKLGHTTREPEERAKELSDATGVPTPFKVLAFFWSCDPESDERRLHKHFAKKRVSTGREFFRISAAEIVSVFERGLEDIGIKPGVKSMGLDVVGLARKARLDIERARPSADKGDYAGVAAARRALAKELKGR